MAFASTRLAPRRVLDPLNAGVAVAGAAPCDTPGTFVSPLTLPLHPQAHAADDNPLAAAGRVASSCHFLAPLVNPSFDYPSSRAERAAPLFSVDARLASSRG
jgi:hypothetical protein